MADDSPTTQDYNRVIVELDELGANTASLLDLMIDPITNVANSWMSDLSEGVTGFIDDVDQSVFDIIKTTEDGFNSTINSVADSLETISNAVSDTVSKSVEDVFQVTVDVANTVTENIDGLMLDANATLTNVVDGVSIFIEDTSADVGEYLVDTYDTVNVQINDLMDVSFDTFEGLKTSADEFISDVSTDVLNIVHELDANIERFVDEVINDIGGSVRDLLETISDLPDEIREFASKLVDSSAENIGEPLKALAGDFSESIAKMLSESNAADKWELSESLMGIADIVEAGSPTPSDFIQQLDKKLPKHPIIKAIASVLVSPLIAFSVMSGIANAQSEVFLQEWSLEYPHKKLPIIDLISAWRRQIIDEAKLELDSRAQGFSSTDIEIFKQSSRTIASENDLVLFWLRGLISDVDLGIEFKGLGYDDITISNIKASAHFIPPVQDLITMAVREVFTPDVAERFGQFEDFPIEFGEWASKQGVSEEWSKNYWAAHWALPSLQMGFGMLHRGAIGVPDLELLMRSQDIMPFWRDKLIDISFSPFTRVDIRRMHKVGILDVKGVNKAYHEIGYNDEKAQALTDFTIALNEAPEDSVVEDVAKLQIAQALELLKDGVIESFDAKQVLLAYGIDPDLADALINGVEIDIERQIRKDTSNQIVEQAISGQITFDVAQDKLQNAGLTQHEINEAVLKISRSDSVKPKLPSKADMDKFIAAELVSSALYLETLGRLGYSETWSNMYLKLLESKQSAS